MGFFGRIETRWMLVKFEGYDEPKYEREHLLRRDDCHAVIRSFWAKSGLLPDKKYYEDTHNHRCDVCAPTFKHKQDLKAYKTRHRYHFQMQKIK